MSWVWIGLGSNLGPREHYLRNAARSLAQLGHVRFASVYETSPVVPAGVSSQVGSFLNTVCRLQTSYNVLEVFCALHRIEHENQRTRPDRLAPRTLDLDLLAFDEVCLALGEAPTRVAGMLSTQFLSGNLVLPHPRMHRRRFVLIPLIEIDPLWKHPLLHCTAPELLADIGDQSLVEWHCAESNLFL